jgi:hypothetical protein
MTPEHQVRAALKVLKPPPERRAACRVAIEDALAIVAEMSIAHDMEEAYRSKAYSRALGTYRRALLRLRAAHQAVLDAGVVPKGVLTLDRIESAIRDANRANAQIVAARAVRAGEVDIRPGAIKPSFAVGLAFELAMDWGASVALTVKGDWWRLAAVLYGESVDLYRHMRMLKPELSLRRGKR